MSKKLVAAQIGCGAFAQQEHGPHVQRNPHISRLKWACDISQDAARDYAEKHSAEKFTESFTDATTDPEVDIILIATSHEAHVPIIESAAEHGKHIFCEKPMAMDEWQGHQIIRAVRRSGVKLCVNYMRRMSPALVAMKREWKAHKNNPQRQPWRYIDTPHNKLTEEKSSDFLVRIQDESSSYRMVHLDAFRGGGLIIGEAVHHIDLACWLFDDDCPVEIRAWGSARMRWGIHLQFQSGNAATLIMSPNGSFDYPKELYEITCDGAFFRNDFYVENQYYGRPGLKREIFPLQRDPLPEVGNQGGLAGYIEKRNALIAETINSKLVFNDLTANHGYEEMFDGFIDSIINNTETPCNELAGYQVTYLANLAIKSIELNQPMPVEVDKWDYHVEL
jgi:predicted dehydrogenase